MTDATITSSTAIAIVGERGSGKTALACSLLDSIRDRPVYVYRHQRPDLIATRGWRQMYRLEQLYDVDNCVVWIDEPQIAIPKLDKRANDGLQTVLSIARHRDITLVLSTCDTRWITRALEAYIDAWFILDLEPALVKQGSIIKKAIKRHVIVDPDEFKLNKGEYLFYGRRFPEKDGKHHFELPGWWSEEWSKPYAIRHEETATDIATGSATGLRQAI